MISKETYMNLVIAGAAIVKDLKAINKANMEVVDNIFEDGVSSYDALKTLVNVAADLTSEDKSYDMAQIYYADCVSVYAYDKKVGEKYFDLLWNQDDEEAKVAFDELSKTVPDDEERWVRRNI